MGVYTNTTRSYGTSSYLENSGIIEPPDYLSVEECAMNIVVESEMNWNSLMRAVAVNELSCLEETGEELIYEASTGGGFLSKVKEFFVNLLAKIKGLFKKFFALIQSYTATDKDFVKKYRADLTKINTRDFTYKGYKFTNVDNISSALENADKNMIEKIADDFASHSDIMNAISDTSTATAKSFKNFAPTKELSTLTTTLDKIIKLDDDPEEFNEKLRGAAAEGVGMSKGNRSASELNDDLFEYYRNGESSKDTIENVSVTDLLNQIDVTKSLRRDAEKQYKALTRAIDDKIKEVDKIEKQYVKMIPNKESLTTDAAREYVGKLIRGINIYTGLLRQESSILQVINTAQLKALKDRNRQAKSVCVSLLNYKPKNEGFYYDDEDGYSSYSEGSNFVNNVVFK